MWHAIAEVLLDLLTMLFAFGRSGPATIDVAADDDRQRVLVMNHGPGVARSVLVAVVTTASDAAPVLADGGRMSVLRPGKWKWLTVEGEPLPAGARVHVAWDRDDGVRSEAEFPLGA
jgi:hypothetical protein